MMQSMYDTRQAGIAASKTEITELARHAQATEAMATRLGTITDNLYTLCSRLGSVPPVSSSEALLDAAQLSGHLPLMESQRIRMYDRLTVIEEYLAHLLRLI